MQVKVLGLAASAVMTGVLMMGSSHAAPIHATRIRVGHTEVHLPWHSAPRSRSEQIADAQRLALQAVGGGQVEGTTVGVWNGDPTWVVTVKGAQVTWNVMVNSQTFQVVSKMMVQH